MPVVDLSNVGLEGQQAFATRMSTLAQGDLMRANAAGQEVENREAERMEALNTEASARLQALTRGQSTSGAVDTNELGSRMDSLASPIELVADVYMRGGAPGKAAEFLKNASEIRKRESDIQNDKVLAEQRRLENIIKGGDLVSRTLGVAKNQSEWENGIRQLKDQGIMEPEYLDQLANMEYDQNVAAYLNEQAISAADRARNDISRETADRLERQTAAQRAQEERKIRMQQARDRETARHNLAIEKNGGDKAGSATSPTPQDLNSAKAALKSTVFKNATDDTVTIDDAAQYVVAQTKTLLKQNKALTWDTAMQQVIMRGEEEGSFGITSDRSWLNNLTGGLVGDEKSTPSFKRPQSGKTPDAPAPLPKSAKEMKKGQYYITSRGVVMWDGARGIPVN